MKALVVAAAMIPAVAFAVVPANGGSVGGVSTTVDNSPGDQLDPHVSGDLAAYTSNGTSTPTIRYFDFLNPGTNTIPTEPGAQDTLSDVNNGHVAFSRQHSGGMRSCLVFDVASLLTIEINSGPMSQVFATALGGNTVAFVDGNSGNGDIRVGTLANPSAFPVTLSGASDFDMNPAVAPSGNLVVWQRCIGGFSNCDIMKSTFAGSWGPSVLVSDSLAEERNPDTDGVNIVYDSDRVSSLSGSDIFYAAATGGPETQLEIAGQQSNPSIAGGVIAFESKAPGASFADVFVYKLSTNALFQITATPGINETLNDVTVLSDGQVRVVWAANDDIFGENNVYARTFTLPEPNPGGGAGGGGGSGGGTGGGGGSGGSGGGGGHGGHHHHHKVKICHVTPGNPSSKQTLELPFLAAWFHLVHHHSDYPGQCHNGGGNGGGHHDDDDDDGHHDDDDDDHGHGSGHGDDDDDDDCGQSSHHLKAEPPADAQGCSAAGGLAPMMFGLLLLALFMRRPLSPARARRK